MQLIYKPTNARVVIVLALILFLFVSGKEGNATSYTWNGSVSTLWGEPNNWTPAGIPDFGDDVIISNQTNNPLYEEVSGLNNFTINSGTLDLNGFTIVITGSANFLGGTISNGGIDCSGTTVFDGATLSATIAVSSSSCSFNGGVYNNPITLTKTGSGNSTSAGGNTFNSTFSLTNNGSGEVQLASIDADTYVGNVTFSNTAGGWISASHSGTGTLYQGNITLNSTGSSLGIRLGQGGGTSTMSSTKTLIIGGSGFSIGDLYLKNFVQSGSTAQSLSLTGTAALYLETGTKFNGVVTFSAPQVYLNGTSFETTASITKSGASNNQSAGGNAFKGTTTIINSGSGDFILGVSSSDAFTGAVTLTNTGSQTLHLAYGSSGTTFTKNIIVNSTGSSKGVRFGQSGGTSTLSSTRTLTVGGAGFSAGSLRIRGLTQSGTTAQTLNITTGTAQLYLETGNTFNGNVSFTFPQIYLSGTTFNGTATITKKGTTANIGSGGNTFASTATITNDGSGLLTLAQTNPDVFQGDVTFNSIGSSAIQIAHAASSTAFNGNIIVNSYNSSLGVRFGQGSGTSTLADTKTITIGAGGFSAGDLVLRGFTQTGSTAQDLTSFTDPCALYLETNCTFNGPVTFSAPMLYLNGTTFNNTALLTKNGTDLGYTVCTGGNTFGGATTISKTGNNDWVLGSSSPDVFNGTLTVENTEFDIIYLADGSGSNSFNGNVDLNSTGNSGGIFFGQNGGSSTLASTKTITIGTSGFSAGDLRLANFTQAGSTSQSLTTFGTGVEVYLESGTTFNGNLTLTAPGVYLNGTTFNTNLTLTKTSSIPNISVGGNVFKGTTIISNTGSGSMTLASASTDDFQGDVTFLQTTAFTLFPAYSVNCTFLKNIITTGSATIIPFSNNGGRVTMSGGTAQTIQGDAARPPDFGNLTINKSSNGVTLNVPITINNGGNLTLTSGILTTTSSNVLAMADNATVTGTSNSSYVSGPCRKEGNDAFTFPVGKGGYYRPIGMSAPANVTSRFTGEFYLADSDGSYAHSSKDVSLDHLSRCEYWILDRNVGTNSVTVTLSWNTPSCGVTVLGDLRVARWNGTTWKDHGNGSTSGNTTSGAVTSSAAITSFSPFTLGSTTPENPLPVHLIDFQATPVDGKVLVEWTTVSETNNDYFSVEVSNDAVSFKEITRISGAGNSNSLLNYRTFDYSPNPDVSYYRLKQVDYDGKLMYSGIRVVNMPTLWENEMVLSPNPVVNIVDVRLDTDHFSKPTIEIRDIQGKLLLKHEVLEINPQIPVKLDLSNYPQGLYFINVKENSVSITRRLIKN